MKKRIIAMLLSICLLFSLMPMTVIAVDEDFGISEDGTFETPDPEATDPEETEPEETEPQETEPEETEPEETEPEETEPENEEPALYDQLMAAESVEDMYLLMLAAMEETPEELLALTTEEIDALRERVNELDPEGDDMDTVDLLDTLAFLPNNADNLPCPDCDQIGEHAEDCPQMQASVLPADGQIGATIISKDTTWNLTRDVNLNGRIKINSGKTLTINGDGHTITKKFSYTNYNDARYYMMFEVYGTLIINGTVIDGNGKTQTTKDVLIEVLNGGSLNFDNVTIQNFYNQAAIKSIESRGGAIRFGNESTCSVKESTIKNSRIQNGSAPEGSAIMLAQKCSGTINIEGTMITGCTTNGEYGGTIRTQGQTNTKVNIRSCTITNNYSIGNGGGVYWNASGSSAALTITGTAAAPTVISNNEAKVRGGGVHLGGQGITIEHTEISGNKAPIGGGISMAPYDTSSVTTAEGCSLTLGAGAKILNNTAETYGGGIYMDVYSASATDAKDFRITVQDGAVIQGNHAQYGGGFAVTQKLITTDTNKNKKYDAYVNIQGGTISGNTATADGGALYINRAYGNAGANYDLEVEISGGQILGNKAANNGGAIYLADNATNSKAKVTVSGGTIGGSEAAAGNNAKNGGAIYVTKGSVDMNGGTISGNTTTADGGAVYVTGGSYTMSNGTISGNTATQNGGAVYVNGGSVTMSDGKMETNTAAGNGGAVYVNNGNFTMTSGEIVSNNATGATSNGGGVYVQGGNIVIGVDGCDGTGTNHTVAPTDKIHPVIENNTAKDSGGGIALVGNGNITMYCGDIVNNQAINSGRGLNIYMEQGQFDYYHGDVGELQSPELVIVGGKLYDRNKETFVELHYYHCNIASHVSSHTGKMVDKVASASEGAWFNLPDGEKYWDAQSGYRFFGWTFNGPGTTQAQAFVRDKDDYSPLGKAMQAIDNHDTDKDNEIHMYALWAPEASSITYIGSVIDGVYAADTLVFPGDHPTQYTFEYSAQDIVISNPTKPGYEFDGWYLYQEENQNANWGIEYEPVYKVGTTSGYGNLDYAQMTAEQFFAAGKNGTTAIKAEATTFGDIVLIAKFTPAFTDLEITKSGASSVDANQSFLFKITGKPDNKSLADVDMTVTIQGNGNVTIQDLPVGTYTVTELESWSWRYDANNASKSVTLSDPTKTEEVAFVNTRTNPKWLDGENFVKNVFAAVTANG